MIESRCSMSCPQPFKAVKKHAENELKSFTSSKASSESWKNCKFATVDDKVYQIVKDTLRYSVTRKRLST